MKGKKFINRWVTLCFDGHKLTTAQIKSIYFHQGLKKPCFILLSKLGNELHLTREELETHAVQN